MAKKNKVTQGASKSFFNFGFGSDKSGKKKGDGVNYVAVLKVFAIAVVLVAIGFLFAFLERYAATAKNIPHKAAKLKIDRPAWVSQELLDKVKEAASRNEDFTLDDDLASNVAQNLKNIAWITNVRVQIIADTIEVYGEWKKPIAIYQAGQQEVYVASDLTILEYVQVIRLPLVELKGVSVKSEPSIGEVWQRDDVAAAIDLLKLLDKMDAQIGTDKGLLFEIAGIDVSNFACRRSQNQPQMILFANDGTNIHWGAPLGMAQRYVEAPDTEKLATLYDFYKMHGKLSGIVKYIELRIPQKNVPSPNM